uniref:Uncharacterized protein n=1 Tax=Ditylenchus dipsaci TaxID=166011 RepID=A0A915DLS7_9BILA
MVKHSENFSTNNKHVVVNVNVCVEIPDPCEDSNSCARMNPMSVSNIPVGSALPIPQNFELSETVVPFPIKIEPKDCQMNQICGSYQEKRMCNPRMYSTDSIIDVNAHPDPFGSGVQAQNQENGSMKSKSQLCVNARDYSLDSLKELFKMPSNFLNDDAATKTAVPHHGSPVGAAPVRRTYTSPKKGSVSNAIVDGGGSLQQQYFTLTPIDVSASGKPMKFIAKPVPQFLRGGPGHLHDLPGLGNEPIVLHRYSPTHHGVVADGHNAALSSNFRDVKIPTDAESSLVTQQGLTSTGHNKLH